jgi:hypothetical protein
MKRIIPYLMLFMLAMPLSLGYIIEIDSHGTAADVVLATQILLDVPGGSAVMSDEITQSERDRNILLYISNGEVSLAKGIYNDEDIPPRLQYYVTADYDTAAPPTTTPKTIQPIANESEECMEGSSIIDFCPDSGIIVRCDCIEGEWACDFSVCDSIGEAIDEELEEYEAVNEGEITIFVEQPAEIEEEKTTLWSRIIRFFMRLFG